MQTAMPVPKAGGIRMVKASPTRAGFIEMREEVVQWLSLGYFSTSRVGNLLALWNAGRWA